MNINELYALKGRLTTEIEIAQAKLQSVNQQIVKTINEASSKTELAGTPPQSNGEVQEPLSN